MRAITESESTPKADGFYMPAEYAPQDRVFMGWPNRPDTFAFGAVPAQRTYAGIANAISEFTPVVMCCNEADYDNCKAVFKDNERVTVMEMSINDAWFRDTGATFLVDGKGGKAATDWHFNAYGGLVDGLYFPWDKDAKIARKMADYVGVRTYRPDHVILEGGSITVDGVSFDPRAWYETTGASNFNSPYANENYVYSATNVRLRELSFGYTFRNLLGNGKNVTASIIGRNLFFFYKDAPCDPDVSAGTGNGWQGIDMFALPTSRSFGLNLKLNF